MCCFFPPHLFGGFLLLHHLPPSSYWLLISFFHLFLWPLVPPSLIPLHSYAHPFLLSLPPFYPSDPLLHLYSQGIIWSLVPARHLGFIDLPSVIPPQPTIGSLPQRNAVTKRYIYNHENRVWPLEGRSACVTSVLSNTGTSIVFMASFCDVLITHRWFRVCGGRRELVRVDVEPWLQNKTCFWRLSQHE